MFNSKAAVQAVDYIIQNLSAQSQTLDKITILKMLFFAERFSLRKYAQSITGDSFVAMKMGPVASKTYDLIKFSPYSDGLEYVSSALEKDGEYGIKSRGVFVNIDDYDELSQSDFEALDFAINKFGIYSPSQLSAITHKYKEWAIFEDAINQNKSSYPMNMDDFFLETTEYTKEYSDISDQHAKLSQEIYNEDKI